MPDKGQNNAKQAPDERRLKRTYNSALRARLFWARRVTLIDRHWIPWN
jgi:hypothetical protein